MAHIERKKVGVIGDIRKTAGEIHTLSDKAAAPHGQSDIAGVALDADEARVRKCIREQPDVAKVCRHFVGEKRRLLRHGGHVCAESFGKVGQRLCSDRATGCQKGLSKGGGHRQFTPCRNTLRPAQDHLDQRRARTGQPGDKDRRGCLSSGACDVGSGGKKRGHTFEFVLRGAPVPGIVPRVQRVQPV